jgi:hypothetical protein
MNLKESAKYMDDICQICNKNEKEVYQLDFEVCYDCWMKQTNPEILVILLVTKFRKIIQENVIWGHARYPII